jgi:hypothetical protein
MPSTPHKETAMAKKHVLVVMSNPVDGREDEYNEWYTNTHLPEVLAIPGFTAAQRFKLSKSQRPGSTPSQWQYAAIYEMESDDPAETMAEIGRQRAAGKVRMTDAIGQTWAYVYEPITGRVVAQEARPRKTA